MDEYRLTVQPSNKLITLPKGGNLLEAFLAAGIDIPVLCNKNGSCGKCRVIVRASANPVNEIERLSLGEGLLAEGYRLACKTEIHGSGEAVVPVESREDFLEGAYWGLELDAIKAGRLPFAVDRAPSRGAYAAAVDVGTTTLTGYLFDHLGRLVSHCSCVNPTALYGSDVVSRMASFQQNAEDFIRVRTGMLRGVERVIQTLYARAAADWGRDGAVPLERVAFCGNTIMQHILLGVNPLAIGLFPYAPMIKNLLRKEAAEIPGFAATGIPAGAEIVLSPSVWGFIGGDAVCGTIATALNQSKDPSLLLDIGTNGEMVLASRGRLYAFSASAGPAFEGYRIGAGMRAVTGAIERIEISAQHGVEYRVIGDERPRGICGTGAIAAVAALVKVGALTEKGHIRPRTTTERIAPNSFVIATAEETSTGMPIVFNDRDVEVVQQAKAAFAAGITALLRQAELKASALRRIYIAGSFGSRVDAENLKVIGLIPSGIDAEIVPVGNAAGLGIATISLSSAAERAAVEIACKIQAIDAALLKDFEDIYLEGLFFRHAAYHQ